MKDLTEKPILGHLLQMTTPIFVGMLFQTLYFLIDLFFVARIGDLRADHVGLRLRVRTGVCGNPRL